MDERGYPFICSYHVPQSICLTLLGQGVFDGLGNVRKKKTLQPSIITHVQISYVELVNSVVGC